MGVAFVTNQELSAFSLADLPSDRFGYGGQDFKTWFLLDGDTPTPWDAPEEGQEVIAE